MVNSNSTTSTTTSAAPPSLQSVHIHHLISVKLDNNNYLLWLTQFQPLLKGYYLEGFVDGTGVCPPRLLEAANGAEVTLNPAYTAWQRQDQILLGWLLSSLTESVLAQVVGMTSSREVWQALQYFSSRFKSRILHLRRELHNVMKGSKNKQQYFLHVKQLADSLAASGNRLSDIDLQYTILTGLDSSYDSIVASLTTSVNDMSMDDFYSHLLTFELRLEDQVSIVQPQPVANVAQMNTNVSRQSNGNWQFSRGSSSRPPHPNNRSHNYRHQQPRNNAEGPYQLCGRKNHNVVNCWFRFDKTFYPHAESHKAYIAAPGFLTDSNWVPNSGATHHLTSDLNNLNIHSPYEGPDQIQVGNGNTLNISHTGSSYGNGTAARQE